MEAPPRQHERQSRAVPDSMAPNELKAIRNEMVICLNWVFSSLSKRISAIRSQTNKKRACSHLAGEGRVAQEPLQSSAQALANRSKVWNYLFACQHPILPADLL